MRERARPATQRELEGIPWLALLEPEHRRMAADDIVVAPAEPGDVICRFGRSATYWFGLVDGLLKMSNEGTSRTTITYAGLPPGGWFGEGTLLKREPYRYNIEALRRSTVAGLPVESFHALLERSLPFNRFILNQLNERLGQFIAAREIDLMNDPDFRVARSLAALFHPVLFPGVGELLRITQQEMGYLVGLSRQRVNEALQTMQRAGVIRIEYGGVRVIDLPRLRDWRPTQ